MSAETDTDIGTPPPAELVLRAATIDDVELVHRFILELAVYERMRDQAVLTVDDLERTLFGERPYAEVILAESGGEAVGFALFFHNYSTFQGRPGIYLEDVYVVPEQRGRGYGRALLARLAEIALERGCGRMDWMVLEWNEGPIAFYRGLGAVAMDDWRHFRLEGEALERLGGGGA